LNAPIPPVLETPHCVLTLLVPEHATLLLDYKRRNQAHLEPWEPASQADQTLDESCRRAAERSAQGFADGTSVQLIALERQTRTMVAGCNFTNIVRGPLQACNLGYSVDQAWQGQGLMQAVVPTGITYMFGTVGLHRIMANHMPSNVRSEKLLRALGFEREGYARAYLRIAGQWEDMVLNALVNPQP
jgi:ribosomal-protein-alanine N-acetyltransferase